MAKSSRNRGNGEGSLYKRGDKWWISWYNEDGVRKNRSAKTTEKRLAERLLQSEVDRVMKINAGLIDPVAEKLVESGRRSINDLAMIYGDKLRAEGRTESHCSRTVREIRDFADASGLDTLREMTSEKAVAYLEKLRKEGWAARTLQCRITSVKSFTRWAWREGLLAADPLAGLKRPNPETDRRLRRKMLRVDEWQWLESCTINGPTRYDMSGSLRVLLYATALQTGLRANELRTLTRSSLYLKGDKPYIRVEAGGTKNRKPAKQYLRPELANLLASHASRMAPGTQVFKVPQWDSSKMLRNDMANARKAWIQSAEHDGAEQAKRRESDFLTHKDADDRTIDFHALRHTCGAWAAIGGASPKAIQTLMRHSTITLTLDTYGHMLPDEASETVGRMPGFDLDQSNAATGTLGTDSSIDKTVCSSVRNGRTIEHESTRTNATGCSEHEERSVVATIGGAGTWCDETRPNTTQCLNSPARIRTEDRTIMSRVETDSTTPRTPDCSSSVRNANNEDPDLLRVIRNWTSLSTNSRNQILAIIDAGIVQIEPEPHSDTVTNDKTPLQR